MPKGHFKRHFRDFGYKQLKKQTHFFSINIRFHHKNSNPRVWEYLKTRLDNDMDDYTNIAEHLVGMSDSELDMLSTPVVAEDLEL